MRLSYLILATTLVSAPARATDPPPRPRQISVPEQSPAAEYKTAASPGAPKFVSEAKWAVAGYNNNEIVYQVFVTNRDTRVIRCMTEVKGFYIEEGIKKVITDRQVTTVMPNEPTQVGTWMDMDQSSGAEYRVQCRIV